MSAPPAVAAATKKAPNKQGPVRSTREREQTGRNMLTLMRHEGLFWHQLDLHVRDAVFKQIPAMEKEVVAGINATRARQERQPLEHDKSLSNAVLKFWNTLDEMSHGFVVMPDNTFNIEYDPKLHLYCTAAPSDRAQVLHLGCLTFRCDLWNLKELPRDVLNFWTRAVHRPDTQLAPYTVAGTQAHADFKEAILRFQMVLHDPQYTKVGIKIRGHTRGDEKKMAFPLRLAVLFQQ